MAITVHPLMMPWVLQLEYEDNSSPLDEWYDYTLCDGRGRLVDSLSFKGMTVGYVESLANVHLPPHGLTLLVIQGNATRELSGSYGPQFNAFTDSREGIRRLQSSDQHEFFARCVAKRKNSELDFDAMPAPVLRDWLKENDLDDYADFAWQLPDD